MVLLPAAHGGKEGYFGVCGKAHVPAHKRLVDGGLHARSAQGFSQRGVLAGEAQAQGLKAGFRRRNNPVSPPGEVA